MAFDWLPVRECPKHVGPVTVRRGGIVSGEVHAAGVSIPLLVLAGERPGPVLYLQALQHGQELNGAEVIRRLLCEVDAREFSGTLIGVPVANPLATRIRQEAYPYNDPSSSRGRNDMNRRWFDNDEGTSAVDALISVLKPLVGLADAAIDFHCHEAILPPLLYAYMEEARTREMAEALNFPVIRATPDAPGKFAWYARETIGVPCVTMEMPPLRLIDAASVQVGLNGVRRLLKGAGMSFGEIPQQRKTLVFGEDEKRRREYILATHDGFFIRHKRAGECVTQGELAGEIISCEKFRTVQEFRAPFDSAIYAIGRPPQYWGEAENDFVSAGEPLVLFWEPEEVLKMPGGYSCCG